MARIYDNIESKFVQGLQKFISDVGIKYYGFTEEELFFHQLQHQIPHGLKVKQLRIEETNYERNNI